MASFLKKAAKGIKTKMMAGGDGGAASSSSAPSDGVERDANGQIPKEPFGRTMQPDAFVAFKTSVDELTTDEEKVEKIYVSHGSGKAPGTAGKSQRQYWCDQAAQLIRLLAFDKNKVTVATRIYPHIADPGNFEDVVLDTLDFSSSKDQVKEELRL
ncbi:uncharacterized protein AMSG_09206 [Thecamonas trahens ATCC 50062]|uniref:DUF4476 domain-containing protein n=1 Tax=Thecamonas trahens ATCC 50062 TaxID=461836 RepID=A0A0L0DM92_THETB|nr:hypothetical protein AMSG_09206 [Thecamonas trahens ATCC 50062]KNC53131.1 hypothetical protein AMSG_09206 [Thecamonas trahens ATCC 50062]|eukprot:XP_013754606.1 hypothetical protein AMSG_09206 [Thecamonas trahens ATCC 50062]